MVTRKNLSKISSESESVFSSLGLNIGREVPDSYKVGRNAVLRLGKAEKDLFSSLEEEKKSYLISGINRKISKMEFTAFSFAMSQILYNESYIAGNLEKNTGRAVKSSTATEKEGKPMYVGDVVTSLNEICRLAYGTKNPDTQQRKAMQKVIDVLDIEPVTIQTGNGSFYQSWLCKKVDRAYSAENGELYYHLYLNAIFCDNVSRNFGELPQDIMMRLSNAVTKKTAAHILLLRLLSIQAKNRPFVRTLKELLNELDLEEAYKVNKNRTISQVLAVCDSMKEIGIITDYIAEYQTIKAKKTITKITYYFATREQFISYNKPKS
jgi:hypothetical protein